jgi:hypothetical protein
MPTYDLCLAWNWEYDQDFAHLLETACARQGLSLLQTGPETVDGLIQDLQSGHVKVRALLDRASDSDPRFQPLVDWVRTQPVRRINPQEQAHWAWDKATMHLEFFTHGVHTPHTLLLPPHQEQPDPPAPDLAPLGGSFAIKPATLGGGQGVQLEAGSWEQVQAARQQYPAEKYLLQAHVKPASIDGRPAWFRVLYCDGAIYPHWWDPQTHAYRPVTAEEKARHALQPLRQMTAQIAQVCQLDLFSTEIARTAGGDFLAVDYVNDPVDLRLQSAAVDGVPDAVVENIAARLARLAARPGPGNAIP